MSYLIPNILASSSWHIANKHIAKIFKSNDAAILISCLVSKHLYFSENSKKYNGWFFCKASEIEEDTICSPHIQRKWFKVFQELDLIKIKLKKVPATQHFKLNEKRLEALLNVRCERPSQLDVEKINNLMLTSLTCNNKNKKNNNKNKKKVKKEKKKKIDPKQKEYLKIASKIAKITESQINKKHTLHQLKQWAVEIRRLETEDKVSLKRQKDILKWYKTSAGGEYIPVVQSGSSFRRKFVNLELAREREKHVPVNGNSNGYRRKDNHKYKKQDAEV